MSHTPIAKKEESKTEAPKVYKSIAPTTVTVKAHPTPSTNSQPLQKNVPAFLNKLYSMVNDPESDDLICWSDDGTSFFVNRQEDFARKVLPRFFKHNKFSSFVRQLNMYGFHKVPHLQHGILDTNGESERWEFSNPHFQRNQPDLLLLVTRKKGPNTDEKEISNVDLHHILEEIQSIKKHQMNISSQLQSIQRDNQVLWQETVSARERHLRHQETIDKILRFLASVFSNGEKRPAIPRKRRFLLGPADGDDHEAELDDGAERAVHEIYEPKDQERPKKAPRKQPPTSTFNIDDYVNSSNDKDGLAGLSTSLPAHLKGSTSTTSSTDLADAIALNDQSKNAENSVLSSLSDLSNISNIPQLQNLQNLISLAQSNPNLLSQLTSEAFYGTPSGTSTTNPQQLSTSPATANVNTTTINKNDPHNNTTDSNASILLPSLTAASPDLKNTRTLKQVTNSISNINQSADALNQDIDDLGFSLQALAQHLGFDPTKTSASEADEDVDQHDNDLLDMDEFLNTYGPDVPPSDASSVTAPDFAPATITDIPSSANTRSPSPAVATPSSTSTQTKQ